MLDSCVEPGARVEVSWVLFLLPVWRLLKNLEVGPLAVSSVSSAGLAEGFENWENRLLDAMVESFSFFFFKASRRLCVEALTDGVDCRRRLSRCRRLVSRVDRVDRVALMMIWC